MNQFAISKHERMRSLFFNPLQEFSMPNINVPKREEVSAGNQAIFDSLKKGMGTTIIPIDFPAAPQLS